MRKVFCLLLLGFFLFRFAWAEGKPGGTNECDFGKVKEGAILRHEFVLKNETAGTLKIIGIDTSCGCTASHAQKQSLSPGESTLISAVFNTRGYSGHVQQFIYVNTDTLGVVRFTVKAEVKKRGEK